MIRRMMMIMAMINAVDDMNDTDDKTRHNNNDTSHKILLDVTFTHFAKSCHRLFDAHKRPSASVRPSRSLHPASR